MDIRSVLMVIKAWSSRTKLVVKKNDDKPRSMRTLFRTNSVFQLDNFRKVCDRRAMTYSNLTFEFTNFILDTMFCLIGCFFVTQHKA